MAAWIPRRWPACSAPAAFRRCLLEGGPRVAGAWWAAGLIDRVMAFVCPQIISGMENRAPLLGAGAVSMDQATPLREVEVRIHRLRPAHLRLRGGALLMFTGLIEEVGTVRRLERRGDGGRLSVQARRVLEGTRLGDSIAVSGACLTVVELGSSGFVVDCMPETLSHTTLGRVTSGAPVNLERSLAAGGPSGRASGAGARRRGGRGAWRSRARASPGR